LAKAAAWKSEARLALFTYIEGWYNPRRRHSALGRVSPTQFERSYAEAGKASNSRPTAGVESV